MAGDVWICSTSFIATAKFVKSSFFFVVQILKKKIMLGTYKIKNALNYLVQFLTTTRL